MVRWMREIVQLPIQFSDLVLNNLPPFILPDQTFDLVERISQTQLQEGNLSVAGDGVFGFCSFQYFAFDRGNVRAAENDRQAGLFLDLVNNIVGVDEIETKHGDADRV